MPNESNPCSCGAPGAHTQIQHLNRLARIIDSPPPKCGHRSLHTKKGVGAIWKQYIFRKGEWRLRRPEVN